MGQGNNHGKNVKKFRIYFDPLFFADSHQPPLELLRQNPNQKFNSLANFTKLSENIRDVLQRYLQFVRFNDLEDNGDNIQLSLKNNFTASEVYKLEKASKHQSNFFRGDTLFFRSTANSSKDENEIKNPENLEDIYSPFDKNKIPRAAADLILLLFHQLVGFLAMRLLRILCSALSSSIHICPNDSKSLFIKSHDEKNQIVTIGLKLENKCYPIQNGKADLETQYNYTFNIDLEVNYRDYTVSFENARLKLPDDALNMDIKETLKKICGHSDNRKNGETCITLITPPLKEIKKLIESLRKTERTNNKLMALCDALEKLSNIPTCFTKEKGEIPIVGFLNIAQAIIQDFQSQNPPQLNSEPKQPTETNTLLALNKILLELAKSPYFSEQLAANATDKFALYFANLCAEKYLASNNEEEKQSYIKNIFALKQHQEKDKGIDIKNKKISHAITDHYKTRVYPVLRKIYMLLSDDSGSLDDYSFPFYSNINPQNSSLYDHYIRDQKGERNPFLYDDACTQETMKQYLSYLLVLGKEKYFHAILDSLITHEHYLLWPELRLTSEEAKNLMNQYSDPLASSFLYLPQNIKPEDDDAIAIFRRTLTRLFSDYFVVRQVDYEVFNDPNRLQVYLQKNNYYSKSTPVLDSNLEAKIINQAVDTFKAQVLPSLPHERIGKTFFYAIAELYKLFEKLEQISTLEGFKNPLKALVDSNTDVGKFILALAGNREYVLDYLETQSYKNATFAAKLEFCNKVWKLELVGKNEIYNHPSNKKIFTKNQQINDVLLETSEEKDKIIEYFKTDKYNQDFTLAAKLEFCNKIIELKIVDKKEIHKQYRDVLQRILDFNRLSFVEQFRNLFVKGYTKNFRNAHEKLTIENITDAAKYGLIDKNVAPKIFPLPAQSWLKKCWNKICFWLHPQKPLWEKFKNEGRENWLILLDTLYFNYDENSAVIKHLDNFLNNLPKKLNDLYLKEDYAKNFYPSEETLRRNLSHQDQTTVARIKHLLAFGKEENAPKELKDWLSKNNDLLQGLEPSKKDNPDQTENRENRNKKTDTHTDDNGAWISSFSKLSKRLQSTTIQDPQQLQKKQNNDPPKVCPQLTGCPSSLFPYAHESEPKAKLDEQNKQGEQNNPTLQR